VQLNTLVHYFLLPIYHPGKYLRKLINDHYKVAYGLIIFLFLGFIYNLSVFLAYQRGFGAQVEPFVKIPAENYYFWQQFFQIPLFLVTAILFAGTARLLSIAFNGQGTYEDIFAICCVALTLPMFLTLWLPETTYFLFFQGSYLGSEGSAPPWPAWVDIVRQLASILWPLGIIVFGIVLSEKLKWFPSIVITLVAAIPMTALMVIFIR
jgi:hypothetical protein